jgi:hypothetical protein
VDLAQLIRFLVVKLINSDSNPRFDMSVAFTANYSFSGRQYPHRQRCAIGDQQSFRGAHRDSVYVCVHRSECSYVYEYLHLYYVFKKGD